MFGWSEIEWEPYDYYLFYLSQVHQQKARYITPLVNENSREFDFRKRNAKYDNWTGKAVNIYSAYGMEGAEVSYGNDIQHKIIDIRTFAKNEIVHKMVGGYCYVITQPKIGPKIYTCLQVAKERFEGGDKYVVTDGMLGLSLPGAATRFCIELYDGSEIGIIYEPGPADEKLNQQPFLRRQILKSMLNDQGMSILAPVFDRLVGVYNMKSHTDLAWRKAAGVVITAPTNEAVKSGSQYQAMLEGQKIESTHLADPAKIKLIEDQIKEQIKDIGSILGLQSEFSEILGVNQSGVSKIIDMLDEKAIVAEIVASSNDVINEAFAVWHEIDNMPGEPDSIKLTGDFRPMGEQLQFDSIKALAEFTNTEATRRICQKAAVRAFANYFSDVEVDEMLADIEENGGGEPYNELLSIGGGAMLSTPTAQPIAASEQMAGQVNQ
jgi:hypothetical protein